LRKKILLMKRSYPRQKTSLPWWLITFYAMPMGILLGWILTIRRRPLPGQAAIILPPIEKEQPETPPIELSTEPNDDLTIIEGIGPKTAAILRAQGIHTFAALAKTDPAELRGILRSMGLRLADPSSWPHQAHLAATGQMEALKALQATLKGGRSA
jgi:hypothetical protein